MRINSKFSGGDVITSLCNSCGLKAAFTSSGAAVYAVYVPDSDNVSRLVTLRPTDGETAKGSYHGKTIGRTAGRIAGATYVLDGKTAVLDRNDFGENTLHGGNSGLWKKTFSSRTVTHGDHTDVIYSYYSPDGEGGYIGDAAITVTYRVYENENRISVLFHAETSGKTFLNLTNHTYWNLSGDLRHDVRDHILYIDAKKAGIADRHFLAGGASACPPAYDFNIPRRIGERLDSGEVQSHTGGYDTLYFFDGGDISKTRAYLRCPTSGIEMYVMTTYPCMVFYSDNMPLEDASVAPGVKDAKYMAACLECMYHPDGIHRMPENCGIFSAGHPYSEETDFVFPPAKAEHR